MKNYIIPVIISLAVLGGGYWWFNQPAAAALEPAANSTVLMGSGNIEAETVAITAELGGRVTELKMAEGDPVKTGQVLVELDKTDLLAQQMQLEVAVIKANANLDLVSALPRPEDVAVAQAQLARAETVRDGAKVTWLKLSELVNNPHELETKVNQAKAQVTQAEYNLEQAKVNLGRVEIGVEAASRSQTTVLGGNEGLVQYEAAQHQAQAAQTAVEMAGVALAGAQKQVEHLIQIRQNPLPLMAQANAAEASYRQAEAAVLAAQSNLAAVEAGPMAEDVDVARAQLREAKTSLAMVEVQLAKQTLTAPRTGLISKKLVEVGELASPGTTLLELSDIEMVDLTVYIPETRIGQVNLGQKARVYVDAYQGEIFEGVVSFIGHEAEFTPKNVQTQEERVNLVFAVKISLDNAGHRLKPGMPADAEILLTSKVNATATPAPALEVEAKPTPTPTQITATPTTQPAPTITATPDLATASQRMQVEVISAGLNVRSGPGTGYPIVATLLKGYTVPVTRVDPASGWLQISLSGDKQVGWISGDPAYVVNK